LLQKGNRQIDDSWADIALSFGFIDDPTGDKLRQRFNNYRRSKGELSGVKTTILHISDLHYPYNLPIDYLEQHKNKIDILIINGDEQDCQSISKFSKVKRNNFMDELIGCRQMIIDIINLVRPKKAILNYGNHNVRLEKYIADKVDDDIGELIPSTNLDLIIDDGFIRYDKENNTKTRYEPIKDMFPKTEVEYTKDWNCKVGKTIFAHPQAYRQGMLATTEKAFQYFSQQSIDFDTIVLAHTHQIGFAKYGAKYLYESGCLCKPMTYGRMNMTKPHATGYLLLSQDEEGNLIYDKSKIICL